MGTTSLPERMLAMNKGIIFFVLLIGFFASIDIYHSANDFLTENAQEIEQIKYALTADDDLLDYPGEWQCCSEDETSEYCTDNCYW